MVEFYEILCAVPSYGKINRYITEGSLTLLYLFLSVHQPNDIFCYHKVTYTTMSSLEHVEEAACTSQAGGETEASIISREGELKLIAIHRELSELVTFLSAARQSPRE